MGFVGAGVVVVLNAEKNPRVIILQHGGDETRTLMGGGGEGCANLYISVLLDEFQLKLTLANNNRF